MQKVVNFLPKGVRGIGQTGKAPVLTGIQRQVAGGNWTHLITIEFYVRLVINDWGEKEKKNIVEGSQDEGANIG